MIGTPRGRRREAKSRGGGGRGSVPARRRPRLKEALRREPQMAATRRTGLADAAATSMLRPGLWGGAASPTSRVGRGLVAVLVLVQVHDAAGKPINTPGPCVSHSARSARVECATGDSTILCANHWAFV